MNGSRRRATDVVKIRTRPDDGVGMISGLGEQVRFGSRFSALLSSPLLEPRLSAGDQLISKGISDG